MMSRIVNAELLVLKAIRKIMHCSPYVKDTAKISGQELNTYIHDALLSDNPLMIARFGSVELNSGVYPYILSLPYNERLSLFFHRRIGFVRKDDSYENSLINPLCNNAGFFPKATNMIPRFSELMQEDVKLMDCCCTCDWEDEKLFEQLFDPKIVFARLEDMEPYDYSEPWSKALIGKKVLVVHPFEKSIKAQYAKRNYLWNNPDVLPAFELKTIKAVQTIAGEKAPFNDWFEALDYMKSQMDAIDYDVAIIGCGAYGFHLAAHAKRTGHKAIHLGGATQILFGIKGKRWEELPAVSKFFNDFWVNPLPEETPKNNTRVEGGCYW